MHHKHIRTRSSGCPGLTAGQQQQCASKVTATPQGKQAKHRTHDSSVAHVLCDSQDSVMLSCRNFCSLCCGGEPDMCRATCDIPPRPPSTPPSRTTPHHACIRGTPPCTSMGQVCLVQHSCSMQPTFECSAYDYTLPLPPSVRPKAQCSPNVHVDAQHPECCNGRPNIPQQLLAQPAIIKAVTAEAPTAGMGKITIP